MKMLATALTGTFVLAGAAMAQAPAPTDGKAALKAAAEKKAASRPAGMSDRTVSKQGGAVTVGAAPAVRNWAEIDTNGDNLIGPDEMEKWLQAQWAAAKK